MGSTILAVFLALLAALLFATASATQQSAAEGVPKEHGQGLAFLRSLVAQPRWWAGVLGDGGGYLLQAAALSVGSLLLVSPLLVSSLLFALPISAAMTRRPLSGRTVGLALALSAALVVFLLVGRPDQGKDTAELSQWLLVLVPVGLLVCCCVVAARFSSGNIRALLFGAAAGISFGISAPLTKTLVALGGENLLALPRSWQLWVFLVASLSGFYLQQLAFQAGSISASLPTLTVAEPLVAALCGSVVFDEHLQVHGLGWAVIAGCVAVMVAATIGLARSQADIGRAS